MSTPFPVSTENSYSIPVVGSQFGGFYGGSVVLDDLLCTGSELNLTECDTGMGSHQCTDHSQDAGVRCMHEVQCEDYSLRLIPEVDLTAEQLYLTEDTLSTNDFIDDEIHRGRLEVCMGENWTSICYDQSWENEDAAVACKQLGFAAFGK